MSGYRATVQNLRTGEVETVTETPSEAAAWWKLYHHRADAEISVELCDLCGERGDNGNHGPRGDCDDDSETGHALSMRAQGFTTTYGPLEAPAPGDQSEHPVMLRYAVEVAR